MTHVVTEHCVRCKYLDCAEVCPVDCFHEGENMVVIDPETCIDCGVCVDACPVNAVVAPSHLGQGSSCKDFDHWAHFNKIYSLEWPRVKDNSLPLPDADAWRDVPEKVRWFSSRPRKDEKSCM